MDRLVTPQALGLDVPDNARVTEAQAIEMLRNRAETAEADADLRATERDSAIDRALSAERQLEAAEAKVSALHEQLDEAEDEITDLSNARRGQEMVEESLRAELSALREQVAQLEERLSNAQGSADVLEEFTDLMWGEGWDQ